MSKSTTDRAIDDGHALETRLTREYGIRHPFVGAGMGFIAHERLAAAVTNTGGLGVLGASPDPADSLPVMVERLCTNAFGPEWPDQPYRLLATPAVLSAEAKGRGPDPQEHGTIGRTRLFPHSANMPYDMPIRSTLPPTPETSGDWDSMVYPAGEGGRRSSKHCPSRRDRPGDDDSGVRHTHD